MRSQLYPFTVAFTWLCNFGFNKTFPYVKTYIGLQGAFWSYAALTLLGAVFLVLGIPETRDKTSEEVAAFFNKSSINESSQSLEAVIEKDMNVV